MCESNLALWGQKEKLPETWGLKRGGGGVLEGGSKQQQMFIISHTHAHTQCYGHISPNSYDEPSRFMQKIGSFHPTPLQLKWILISVTSSPCHWYLPALHSSILHVYIPSVFPLFLPSTLQPALCFYHLTVGVLAPWKGRGNDGRWKNETKNETSLEPYVRHLFPGDIKKTEWYSQLYYPSIWRFMWGSRQG